jgi:hypothetical protein
MRSLDPNTRPTALLPGEAGDQPKEALTLQVDAETMGHACCCGSRVPGR